MRQLMFVFLLVASVLALASVTNAQARQTYFSSGDSCEAALASGSFNYYRPTYFGLHKKLGAGEEVRGLESDVCVEMLTVKGYQWVVQKEGEKMVFKGLNIVRREDCGNPIRDIRHPKTAVDVPPAPKCPEGTYPSETPGVCIAEKEKEKIITKTVEVEKPVYINPCPTDAEFDGKTSWKSRLGGGLVQAGISYGGSLAISKVRGSDWDDANYSGLKGLATQRIQQVANASEDGVKLRIPSLGIDQKISRGKDVDFANGVSVRWNGSRVALFRNLNGQSFRCDGFGLKKGSNLGIWTDGGDGKTPVKTQTPNEIPVRPGEPGIRLPGGGVTVDTSNGIPTRPRRNLVEQLTPSFPSNQMVNNNSAGAAQQNTSTCKGQLIILGGKQRCVND